MAQEKLYFLFIRSLILLNGHLKEKNYDALSNFVGNLSGFILFERNEKEKTSKTSNLLKNLYILYLYFSNYPYLYGVLTDEEIDAIISEFPPDINEIALSLIYCLGFNSLFDIVDALASRVDKGISILQEKEILKGLQILLIKIYFSQDQIKG